MESFKELLTAEFEALRRDIVAAYEASGMKATGNWGRELSVEITEGRAAIMAPGYINGRGPGKQPPSEAIEEWIKAKGVASGIDKEMNTESLAYLIARKIGREGWKPAEGRQNIVSSVATPERIQAIMDKIEASATQNICGELLSYLKQAIQ